MNRRPYHIIAGSFVVAVLFWFSVTLGGTYIAIFTIPLSVSNLPSDLALANPLPKTIEVSLEGQGWQLLFLSISHQLSFEISGNRLRTERVFLTNRFLTEAMKLPSGIQAIHAYPETLFVALDTYEEKRIPVNLLINTLTYKNGFGLTGSIRINPDSITISGAQKVLRSIESWSTIPTSFEELSFPVVKNIPLIDSLPGLIKLKQKTVRLFIPVEQLADVVFENVNITVNDIPKDKQVLLANSFVDVYVRGGVNMLATMSSDDFSAVIEYRTIMADTSGTVIPSVMLPEGIEVLKINPPQIKYTVRQLSNK